jgi:Flp pilus assembly protein TadG
MTLAGAARSLRMGLRSLARNRSGVTALEFAFVAPVFLTLTCMIMEVGLLMFSQSVLDGAVRNAARLIQTGQVQVNDGSTDTSFQAMLCSVFNSPLLDCRGLVWSVQAADSFGALAAIDQTPPTQSSFVPGGPGQAVAVRVVYTQAALLPFVGKLLSPSGSVQLNTTVVFRNESYQ